jgi:hypothetical protein
MNRINEIEEIIKKIEESEKMQFPSELNNIYLELNGFCGMRGMSYISIFKIDELIELNHSYEVELNFPGFFIFASDGGGESFGFIKNEEFEIKMVPFIGMCKKDAISIAKTKNAFLDKLNRGALDE